ncbi:MAG: hypothetical protein NTW73_00965 [Candidatus Parcubacteria bacterium]|nr:hypothetical protein [Candidatus Parcubacteria bacterium]
MISFKKIIIFFVLFWLSLALDLYFPFPANIHVSFLMIYGIFFFFNYGLKNALIVSFVAGLILDALNFFAVFNQCLILPVSILAIYFLSRVLNSDNSGSKLILGIATLFIFELLKCLNFLILKQHFSAIFLLYNFLINIIIFSFIIYLIDRIKKHALHH